MVATLQALRVLLVVLFTPSSVSYMIHLKKQKIKIILKIILCKIYKNILKKLLTDPVWGVGWKDPSALDTPLHTSKKVKGGQMGLTKSMGMW